ncbi:MAG TPA: FRG domain-containing protein [Thermoanaerobaculia bacterium]|nr:FRG domain-containing protein [Thermoanaerobaculia bacterium]
MTVRLDGTIDSIAKAVDIVRDLRRDSMVTRPKGWPFHKFPFGVWFRGQPQLGLPLVPRVHRDHRIVDGKTRFGGWDETNIFEHLKVRAPGYQATYRTAFDWLCLMQHYSVPTRLLDWSEYILPALYFAVKDDLREAGELIVLNARRLNPPGARLPSIFPPGEGQVVIRAEMAWTRRASKLRHKHTVVEALAEEAIEASERDWLVRFCTPIPVFPSRLNDRMVFQSSVFTLHGGKCYPGRMRQYYGRDAMPEPVTLEDIERDRGPAERILKRYEIPRKAKRPILDSLFLLGIHEATLFPEVDRQAVYLEDLWWHAKRRAGARRHFP